MRKQPFKRIGIVLIIGSCIGSCVLNHHYGWNMVAQSTPEAIADLTHVLIALVGAVLYTIGASND